MEPNEIKSLSIKIRPTDKRCKYWAKILRKGAKLPMPSDVSGAQDVPGPYLRLGDEELLLGDILIEGEAVHHVRERGWAYWVTTIGGDGELVLYRPNSDIKAQMKAKGMPVELLPGSGEVAACIRIAHGLQLGLVDAPKEEL